MSAALCRHSSVHSPPALGRTKVLAPSFREGQPVLGAFIHSSIPVPLGVSTTVFELLHVALLEYFPFIILLLSLFRVTGGIRSLGSFRGAARVNTGILAIDTLLASGWEPPVPPWL